MICEGRVKGCFQIESRLGKTWCEKLRPRSISELADLISAIRPGTLKAIVDGKSMTQHLADRKSGKEEVVYPHESLEEILKPTYGVILYQEQAMQIAVKVAGFSETQADSLRKAMGKKLADLMQKVRTEFIEGCKLTGIVSDSVAGDIFDIIEKANRYSFNKCISPDTLVELEDGSLLDIDSISIGDKIKAPNYDHKIDEYVEVINKYENGDKEVFEVTLEDGKFIICTIDHKFLCDDGNKYSLEEIVRTNKNIICEDD